MDGIDGFPSDGTISDEAGVDPLTGVGVNDAPVTTADSASTNADTAVNGTVVDNTTDADDDVATELAYALVGDSPVGLTFNADGTWSFDPGGLFDSLGSGATTEVTFNYKANDGEADSNVSTVTITVTGTNDAAVIAGDDAAAVTEDSALSDSGALTVADVDSGEASFVAGAYAGAYGSFALAADGAWTYTLDNAAAQRRVRMDTANMKSAYCNFFAAQDNPNEVVLNFGFNQRWGQVETDVQVQLLQQVILHPATARRVKDTLVALFQKRDAPRGGASASSGAPKKAN